MLTEAELSILSRRAAANDLLAEPSRYVFPGPGESGHLTDNKRSWHSFCVRAKIQNLHIHDLRRSLASWMASTGANVAVIRSALNHKDIKTTLTVYALANQNAELAARQLAHKTMIELSKSESVDSIESKRVEAEF